MFSFCFGFLLLVDRTQTQRFVVYLCLHYAFHMDKNCNVSLLLSLCVCYVQQNDLKRGSIFCLIRASTQKMPNISRDVFVCTLHLISIDMFFFVFGLKLGPTNNANVFSTTLTMSCTGRARLSSLNIVFFCYC